MKQNNMCGYFFNAYLEKDFSSNNGYNCNHPKQEECDINEETGEEIGKCYCWSCPLGFEAELEDFSDPTIDNNGYNEDYYEEMTYIIVEDSEKYEE